MKEGNPGLAIRREVGFDGYAGVEKEELLWGWGEECDGIYK